MLESEQYKAVCKQEFMEIKKSLSIIDKSLRGNGKVGMVVRIDRLEQAEATRSRLLWVIATTVIGLLVATIWHGIVINR